MVLVDGSQNYVVSAETPNTIKKGIEKYNLFASVGVKNGPELAWAYGAKQYLSQVRMEPCGLLGFN